MKTLSLVACIVALALLQACKPAKPTNNGVKQPTASSNTPVYKTDAAKANFYYALAKTDPDAKEILRSTKNTEEFTRYASGSSPKQLIDDYGTVIHESCHGYNFDIGGFDGEGYFLGNGIKIIAPKGEVFVSTELNQVVPKDWQKQIFRYNTYVGNGSRVSSQKDGLYGMLNEFIAYYHGSKAQVLLKDYYTAQCSYQNVDCWTDYITHPASEMSAYYEFRLFMAWYLNHAEKKYPAVYTSLMNNQSLRVAYTLADQAFAQLWTDYLQKREEVMAGLKTAGHNVAIKNGFFYVYKSDGSSHGVGVADNTVEYLSGLFTEKDLQQLKKFSIEGVNQSNYQSFLKR